MQDVSCCTDSFSLKLPMIVLEMLQLVAKIFQSVVLMFFFFFPSAELPNSYDYKLVNDDLDATYDEFKAIIDKVITFGISVV